MIRLTAKGRRLGETVYAAAGAAQLQIEEISGPRRFAQLHTSLELLTEQLEGSSTIPRRRVCGHAECLSPGKVAVMIAELDRILVFVGLGKLFECQSADPVEGRTVHECQRGRFQCTEPAHRRRGVGSERRAAEQ